MNSTATEDSVAVVEGPRGKAEIFELWSGGRLIEYKVRVGQEVDTYENIGEAYVAAGQKVGRQT